MNLPRFVTNPDPEIYLSDNYVVLDFETTNIDYGSPYESDNRLLLACWEVGPDHRSAGESRRRHAWGSEFEQLRLLDDIASANFIVAHNAKFEAGWLARCGADLRNLLAYCTQIGEYCYAGNRKLPGGLSLEATCTRYGIQGKRSFVAALISAGICPSECPRGALLDYCAQDVRATTALFLLQRESLRELGLLPVAYCRNLVTPVLADIESRGLCMEPSRVLDKYAACAVQYNALAADFKAFTGGINPKSPQQMAGYVYDKLGFTELTDRNGPIRSPAHGKVSKKGKVKDGRKTDKLTLPRLEANTDEQKAFKQMALDMAKLKVPMQNLEKLKTLCDAGKTIMYAEINQTVTGTHRLSSSARKGGMQHQNIDRSFKDIFKARNPGSVVIDADAPQLEFRVAAHEGNDEVAVADIVQGEDIHALTAKVYNCSRQNAKSRTFAPLYGSTSGTKQDIAYQKAFREKYSGIYKTQEAWTYKVLKDKQLRISSGLIFYWPDTELQQRKHGKPYITNTTSIFNYPIQSFATADIIPLTLVLLWHAMKDMPDAFIVATIHDSVVIECPESLVDCLVENVVHCFKEGVISLLQKLYGVTMRVPLGVGIKVGPYWGQGPERKF